METKINAIRWAVDQDGTWLHLRVENGREARAFAEQMKDKLLRMKLVLWREKRSLSANAYAWVLIGKLSAALGIPPTEVYRQYIPDIGGNSVVVRIPLPEIDRYTRSWQSNGMGWITEVIGAAGPGLVDVMCYYGSSVYDTAQMARLIDLIIEDCKAQGIEYLPPDKLAGMLEAWNEKTHESTGDSGDG